MRVWAHLFVDETDDTVVDDSTGVAVMNAGAMSELPRGSEDNIRTEIGNDVVARTSIVSLATVEPY